MGNTLELTMEQLEELFAAKTADAVKAALESLPPVKSGGVVAPEPVASPEQTDAERESAAFKSFLHGGSPAGMRRDNTKATIVEGTAANGGYLVPERWSNELVAPLNNLSYMRRAGARVMNIAGTDAFRVPRIIYSAAAVLTAESAAYTQSEPTFAEVLFTPYKFTKLSKASEEVVADSAFPIWDAILRPDYEQAFAAAENTYFTTGTGSAQPEGIVTTASAGITAAGTTAITADELINLYFSLDYKYRANATWMMNDATVGIIRRLKDSNNQYIWAPGLDGAVGGTLLGRPIVMNNSMATAAAGAVTVLFGDFSYFWIADFGGMFMQRLNELYAANGHVGFRAYKRFDSHLMLTDAVKKLTMAAS